MRARADLWVLRSAACALALALASGAAVALDAASPSSPVDLTRTLVDLNGQYHAASATARPEILRELLRVAAERQKALAALMQTDPGAVLRAALPAGLRASFPPEVRPYVEEEVELEGVVEVLHEDRDAGSRYLYFLETGGQRYTLHFASDAPALLTGTRLRVKGVRVGLDVAL